MEEALNLLVGMCVALVAGILVGLLPEAVEGYTGPCGQDLRVRRGTKKMEKGEPHECRPYGSYWCKDGTYWPCPGAAYRAANQYAPVGVPKKR